MFESVLSSSGFSHEDAELPGHAPVLLEDVDGFKATLEVAPPIEGLELSQYEDIDPKL